MNYFSVCSGVEAASQAWTPLGWKPVAFSEIEPHPCAVLASRFPKVPNLGDMTKIHYNRETKELTNGTTRLLCNDGIDLLVGGSPCQGFSVAGLRKGLAEDGKSGLAKHYIRLLHEIEPRWFVFENVPGLLSSRTFAESDGRTGRVLDFNFLLYSFAKCGYDLDWRVLDTQYTKVPRFIDANGRVSGFPYAIPQRRRRVFVVGRRNDGRGVQPFGRPSADGGGRSEVLLVEEGVFGHIAPRRVKGKGASGDIEKGTGGADASGCLTNGVTTQSHSVYGEGGAMGCLPSCGRQKGHEGHDCSSVCVSFKGGQSVVESNCFNAYQGTHDAVVAKDVEIPSVAHDQTAVAISFKGGQSAAGGLGVDEGACQTMQSKMSALEPTVAIGVKFGEMVRLSNHEQVNREQMPTLSKSDGKAGDNTPTVAIRAAGGDGEGMAFVPYGTRLGAETHGVAETMARIDEKFPQCVTVKVGGGVECLTPHDPQNERIYGGNGASWAQSANSGGGQDRRAICVRTGNIHANGCGEAVGIGHGNQGGTGSPCKETMPTLTSDDYKGPMPAVAIRTENDHANGENTAICVKTANTKSNGDNVNQSGAAYTIDGANGHAVAYSYDGYNQRAWREVSMTERMAATGTEGNDADVKVAIREVVDPDKEYADAVRRGDQMSALRMITDMASRALKDSKIKWVVTHVTDSKFSRFERWAIKGGMLGWGFYFADEYSDAAVPDGDYEMSCFLDIRNPFVVQPFYEPQTRAVIEDIRREVGGGWSVDDAVRHVMSYREGNDIYFAVSEIMRLFGNDDEGENQRAFTDFLKRRGYDGVRSEDLGETVAFDPDQIVSAEITYGEDGRLLPLSERFARRVSCQGGVALAVPICFQQNQRCEVRDLGGAAGALQSEPGAKQQNYLALPVALRGNRRAGEEGKLAETDGGGAAYSLTGVQTDSMVATREWRTTGGEDVMPTPDTRLAAQADGQMERSGGYLCGPMP